MNWGSVSTGISAASVAWKDLNWEAQWFSEIDPFCNRLLKHYYPHVRNLGDMRKLSGKIEYERSTINLLEGGTPCQGFSYAGLRGGLDDERSNLSRQFIRILSQKRPNWFVWENVPGVLSSFSDGEDGREWSDFATLLMEFRNIGYQCCYRIFDSQYFGVPQRRRRIFVVGYLGDWRPPFAVLFEPEGLRRDITPSREAGKEAAGATENGAGNTGWPADVSPTLDAHYGTKWGQDNQHIKAGAGLFVPLSTYTHPNDRLGFKEDQVANTIKTSFDGSDRNCGALVLCIDGRNGEESDVAPTLQSHHSSLNSIPLVYDQSKVVFNNGQNPDAGLVAPTLTTINPHIVVTEKVRRLTPLECERLMGFPDNYTLIPGAKDSPRYVALGNSINVDVLRWIGNRIALVEKLLKAI